MKILFGIQGTGNGHITRARAMATAFQNKNQEVDFVVSGRSPDKLFDMGIFGDFRCYQGLTFVTVNGRVSKVKTALKNNLYRFYRDVKSLDLGSYDLVVSDFEPVSAWAARNQNITSIAIGHQPAFKYDVPKRDDDFMSRQIMNIFAPTTIHLGLHWHHFNQPLLPPIIETSAEQPAVEADKILVYLPFENSQHVVDWLKPYTNRRFYVYHENIDIKAADHITLCPLSRVTFPKDLITSNGVIANAGFELSSEAISQGKKILVKPLHGQYEQSSNAKALKQLGLGEEMKSLDSQILEQWLEQDGVGTVHYPDVAAAIVDWICSGMHSSTIELSHQLWQATRFPEEIKENTTQSALVSTQAV